MKRLFLCFMAIVLIGSSLVPYVGHANTGSRIELQGDINNRTSADNPLQVFNGVIKIDGFVTAADPRDVKVTVTQVDSKSRIDYSNAPITINRDFTFEALPLFSGVNELRFTLPNTNKIVYVEYVNAPSLHNLEVFVPGSNYQRLLEYKVLNPFASYNDSDRALSFDRVKKSLSNAVNIRGMTNNVDAIYINGEIGVNNPPPIFSHNLAMHGIDKGNYNVAFQTINYDGSTFDFTYPMALETSEPTFLNVAVKTDGNGVGHLDPFRAKLINLQNNEVEVGTDLYIYKDSADNLQNFHKVVLEVRDQNGELKSKQELVNGDPLPAGMTKIAESSTYRVFRINTTLDNPIQATTQGEYELSLTVWETADRAYTPQKFKFKHVDENQPYIEDIIIKGSGISLPITKTINSRKEQLEVIVNSKTDFVDFVTTGITKRATVQNGKATFDLSDLERGSHTFTFTPNAGPTSAPTPGEAFVINVEVILTPTVTVRGIANGSIIRHTNEINDVTVTYVNMNPPVDGQRTTIVFNDYTLQASDLIGAKTDESFKIKRSVLQNRTDHLRIGNNTLRIIVEPSDGSKTTVEIRFQFLPEETPSIGRFYPVSAHDGKTDVFQEIPGQAGNYVTMEKDVKLIADIVNDFTRAVILKKNSVVIAKYYRNSSGNWVPYDGKNIDGMTLKAEKYGDNDGMKITTPNHRPDYFEIGKEFSLLERNQYGEVNYSTTTIYTLEAYNGFNITTEQEQYPMNQASITIFRQAEAFELDGEAKRIVDLENGVTNKNYFPFEAWIEKADKVTIGKAEATKVANVMDDQGREKWLLNVPLKKGLNKIKVDITRGSSTVSSTLEIFFAEIGNLGSAYRETLGKKTSFKLFGNNLELKFPKGTVLEARAEAVEENLRFSRLLNETSLLFGKADPTWGILTETEATHYYRHRLSQDLTNTLDQKYSFASDLYYIDLGTVFSGQGLLPLESDIIDVDNNRIGQTIIDRKIDRHKYDLRPSSPGDLTIAYKDAIRDDLTRRLTVLHFDGGEWKNIGGVLNAKKQTITVPMTESGYYVVARVREAYPDITNHPWAKHELELLSSRGWMNPSGAGNNFGAYEVATRGEFATMLVKVFNIPLDYEDGPETFFDVPRRLVLNTYEYKYIETAARVGIVHGKNVGYFDPNGSLTREQAASMIARAANYRVNTIERASQRLEKQFQDAKNINDYARPFVEAVANKGIMTGKPVPNSDPNVKKQPLNFDPSSALTRDELAVITYRLLQDQKILPK